MLRKSHTNIVLTDYHLTQTAPNGSKHSVILILDYDGFILLSSNSRVHLLGLSRGFPQWTALLLSLLSHDHNSLLCPRN